MEQVVKPGPQNYYNQIGLLEDFDQLLFSLGFSQVVCIIDSGGWYSVEPFFPQKFEKVTVSFIEFDGECSLFESKRLAQFAKEKNAQAVVSIGGGKAMDVVKLVADQLKIDYIQVPTIAATCACWAPLAVVYTPRGEYENVFHFRQTARLVITDPRVLIQAEEKYFVAGLADTIAKWYEGRVQLENMSRTPNLELGYQASKICYEFIIKKAKEALRAVQTKQINQAFIDLLDVIFATAGSASGYAGEYGHAAAHGVHNGLTVLKETKSFLHGELVGYGILVQLVLEDKWEDVDELLALYNILNLPIQLNDLNLSLEHPDLNKALYAMCMGEDQLMQVVRPSITPQEIKEAMSQLEEYVASKK